MEPTYQSDCGRVTLYLADCLDVLPTLGGVDCVITDPPYGIGAGEMNLGCWASSRVEPSAWDDLPPTQDALAAVARIGSRAVLWGMNYFQLPPTRNYLVWDKGAGFKSRSFAECELAWCSWDGVARILQRDPLAAGDYKDRTHKTQKPVEVMQWSLRHAEVDFGQTVADFYMGSGTTGVAALRMGCNFIGIEIEPKYYEIAKRRILAELAQKKMF